MADRAAEELQKALHAAEARAAEVSALLEGARAILEMHTFEDAARAVFHACKKATGAESGYVALLSGDGVRNDVVFLDSCGDPCTVDPSLPMLVRGLRAEVYRTGKAVYHNDFANSPFASLLPQGHVRLANALFAPLKSGGKTVGLLGVGNKSGGFDDNDARIATAFGELAAVALMNARMRESLETSEEDYRLHFENASDVIFTLDGEFRFLRVSPSITRVLGYRPEDLLGRRFDEVGIVAPEHVETAIANALRVLSGETIEGAVYEVVAKDGSRKVAEVNTTPMSREGKVVAIVSVARDITDRKRAEEAMAEARREAEAANRAKGEFLATMSHEIRTPMTAVMGYADLLTSLDLSPEESRQFSETIHRNAESLLALLDDILDLSKIEADRLRLERIDCSPQRIVEGVLELMQVRAAEKGVELRADYDFPIPRAIRTDPIQLRQILLNLVGNAVKFTERGSVGITVRCLREEGGAARVQFEVADTGIGMTAEELRGVFHPFCQADMSTTRRFGGTGLGLAISQRLAGMLGGAIEVSSEPGRGSAFTLTIEPGSLEGVAMLDAPEPPADRQRPVAVPPRVRLRGRILLAEDARDLQRLVSFVLRRLGAEVDVARNGRVACEMAEASKAEGEPYDLILMDIRMPEVDGYEAARRLRGAGWTGPIVALTAHAMPGAREKCLEAGCDDYLAKPSHVHELLHVVARYIADDDRGGGPAADALPPQMAAALPEMFSDPDAVALIREFVAELPHRANAIAAALKRLDIDSLRRSSHQLKGAAALYGFSAIAQIAKDVNELAHKEVGAHLRAHVRKLVAMCREAASQTFGPAAPPETQPPSAGPDGK